MRARKTRSSDTPAGWDLLEGYRAARQERLIPGTASADMKRGWAIGRARIRAERAAERAAEVQFRARRDARRAKATTHQQKLHA